MNKYTCKNCEHVFQSPKKKPKCPKCKGSNLRKWFPTDRQVKSNPPNTFML